jgi:RimJ/RimL family protein N-acetyltransferase
LPVLAEPDEMAGEVGRVDPRWTSPKRLWASDLERMHLWLNAPHVRRRWYEEGTSYQEIEEGYLPRTDGREAPRPFVILHKDKAIGYIQSHLISDEGYASLVEVEDSAGVELFVGETEYLYRTLGKNIVRSFLFEHVFSDLGIAVCVTGPDVTGPEPKNAAAIRAYEKAGFRYFKSTHVPGEPEDLMMLGREEFERDVVGQA